jgi:hypothetical protein
MVMVRLAPVDSPSSSVLLPIEPLVRTWAFAIWFTLTVNEPVEAAVDVVAVNAVFVLLTEVEFQVAAFASAAVAVCRLVMALCSLPYALSWALYVVCWLVIVVSLVFSAVSN